MITWISGVSPRLKARITGAVYLISGQAFSFSEFSVRGKLVVDGDAAAHPGNQTLYRWGFTAEVVPLCLIVTFILYDLLKPVKRSTNWPMYSASWDALFRLSTASFISPRCSFLEA